MTMYRYMLGDVLNGGCVIALSKEEAIAKVKAFYAECATYCESNEHLVDEDITVWNDDEGFIKNCPDVVEVY